MEIQLLAKRTWTAKAWDFNVFWETMSCTNTKETNKV